MYILLVFGGSKFKVLIFSPSFLVELLTRKYSGCLYYNFICFDQRLCCTFCFSDRFWSNFDVCVTGEETADKEQENEIQEGFSNFKVIFQICFDM